MYKNKINFKNKDFIYEVPLDFDPITKFLMKFDIYEKKERTLLKKMLPNTDIIEAGAGIGLISMYLKKKIKNNRLFMIEPNIEMNKIIKKNFKLNNFDENEINLLNFGLSDSEKLDVPFFKFESDMANTVSNETLDYNFKKKDITKINTLSINSIIKKYNICDFQLVLDIEGEEINVLKKNNEWMKNCKSILLENHLPKIKLRELNKYVVNKGYKIIDKKENVFLFIKN